MFRHSTRVHWALWTLTGFVFLTVVFRIWARSQSGPDVFIDPPQIILDSALQNEDIPFQCKIKNHSQFPIEILAVTTSCACTMVNGLSVGTRVEPNGSLPLALRVNTGRADGELTSLITVEYKSQGEIDVTSASVRCNVVPEYRLTSSVLNFGTVHGDDGATRSVSLLPANASDAAILSAESSNANFAVVQAKAGPNTLAVTFRPDTSLLSRREYHGQLTITTSNSRAPKATVSLHAYHVPMVVADPPAIVLTNSSPSGPNRVTLSTENPSRILSLTSGNPAVAVDVITGDESRRVHELLVSVSRKQFDVSTDIVVSIQIGSSDSPQLVAVPVQLLDTLALERLP